MTADHRVVELIRREAAMAYRLTLLMLTAVQDGDQSLGDAVDTADLIGDAQDWSVRQWQQGIVPTSYTD